MNNFIQNCTGVILAGGENKRMPVLKGFIQVEGRKIVDRNLNILKKLFREVFIVTNQPELYAHLGVPMLGDVYDTRGPITGVFTALLNSSNQWIFVSACDMPFLNSGLIRYMASFCHPEHVSGSEQEMLKRVQHDKSGTISRLPAYDVVVPILNNKAEPLFAFYSQKTLTSLEQFIMTGKKGIKDFLLNRNNRVKYITSEEIISIDPEARSFINLNTPEDVGYYLDSEDRLRFEKKLLRRRQCSDLERRS
ncbi:MAG: molybdenum cofactor guanylyltransferase [Nitrospirae bacterium]|nr:molybdenum cofactor guanylyltransferase [Nitrospirota bacterium]